MNNPHRWDNKDLSCYGTIEKYINQYAKAKRELLNSSSNSIDEKELIDEIVSTPKYDSSTRKKAKLTDAIIERIEFFLKENEQKRARGQGKQQKPNKHVEKVARFTNRAYLGGIEILI